MTPCKKLFIIAEIFNDDMAILATAIKITISKDEHKTILKNLINQKIDQYSQNIDILFLISQDHYAIDGLIAIVEAIHSRIEHGVDQIRSNIDTGMIIGDDTVKGEQLNLFNMEE